jgi:hypothetical protein
MWLIPGSESQRTMTRHAATGNDGPSVPRGDPPDKQKGPAGPFSFHSWSARRVDHSGRTSTRTRIRSPGW